MAEYKVPATRKAIKSKIKAILIDWVDENLDDTGDTNTAWDDADDAAARAYQDYIEGGNSHNGAMKGVRECFWDQLKAGLSVQLESVFEELGE